MPSVFFEDEGKRTSLMSQDETERWYANVEVVGHKLLRKVDSLLACSTDEAKVRRLWLHRAQIEAIMRRARQIQFSSSEVEEPTRVSQIRLH